MYDSAPTKPRAPSILKFHSKYSIAHDSTWISIWNICTIFIQCAKHNIGIRQLNFPEKKGIFSSRKSVNQNETPYLFAKTHKSQITFECQCEKFGNSNFWIWTRCGTKEKRKMPDPKIRFFSLPICYKSYIYTLLYVRCTMYDLLLLVIVVLPFQLSTHTIAPELRTHTHTKENLVKNGLWRCLYTCIKWVCCEWKFAIH